MRYIKLLIVGMLFSGCAITDEGITLNPPEPQINICLNAVTDEEANEMKEQIEAESFKSERLKKAKILGKNRCFQANQVVVLMEGLSFESNKLEIAKYLYTKTKNQDDYEIVVAALTYLSSKNELRDYIAAMN